MNYKYIILFSVIMSAVGLSCEKEDSYCNAGQFYFMAFGHFYGKCGGEGCVEIYKIENEKLYEETRDQYPGDEFYKFEEFVQLSNEKYDQVKDLPSDFPNELWDESETILGIPDGGDWGGVYVEISSSRGHRYFLLDQNENNMASVYNTFVDKINEKITIINQ
ncbi:MAG: hypothetical protein M3R25_05505 [Bacteroidota bacterium]|nr:hypothetical protein [Bacteroidota bacterium]